jgi:hypothetical protein
MSIVALNYVWQHASELPDRALIVGLKIADHHNGQTGQCNPSVATLIEETGRSRSTVLRGIKDLEDATGITVERRKNRNNRYTIPGCKVWAVGVTPDTYVGVNGETSEVSTVTPESEVKPEVEPEKNSFGGTANASRSSAEGKQTRESRDRAERRLLENFSTQRCRADAKTRLKLFMEAGRAFTDDDCFHKPKNPKKPLSFSDTDSLRVWFETLHQSGVEVLVFAMKNWSRLYDQMHPAVQKKVTRVPTMRNLMQYSDCAGSDTPVADLLRKYEDARREQMLRQVEQHAPPVDDYYREECHA